MELAAGFSSGEGLFQTKVEGTGTVILKAQGKIQAINLNDQKLVVDGSFAVARQAHMSMNIGPRSMADRLINQTFPSRIFLYFRTGGEAN